MSPLAQVVPDTYTEGARLTEAGGRVSQGGLRTLERYVVLVAEVLHVGIQVDVGPEYPVPEGTEVEHGVGGCRVRRRQQTLTGLAVTGVENVRKVGLAAVVQRQCRGDTTDGRGNGPDELGACRDGVLGNLGRCTAAQIPAQHLAHRRKRERSVVRFHEGP